MQRNREILFWESEDAAEVWLEDKRYILILTNVGIEQGFFSISGYRQRQGHFFLFSTGRAFFAMTIS